MTDRTPSTAAGRALLARLSLDVPWFIAGSVAAETDLILAIEAEARTPLDVERLARAFWSVTRERFAASPLVPDLPEWRDPSIDAATWDKSVSDAAEVAREYEAQP